MTSIIFLLGVAFILAGLWALHPGLAAVAAGVLLCAFAVGLHTHADEKVKATE